MKLIYRALQIETTACPVQPYVEPRAINWRFQPPAMLPAEARQKIVSSAVTQAEFGFLQETWLKGNWLAIDS